MKAFVREQIFLTLVLLWNLGSVIKIKLHLAVDERKHCLAGRLKLIVPEITVCPHHSVMQIKYVEMEQCCGKSLR